MKINKKLSTAIVLSLMMGVYGSASAGTNEILYGSSTNGGMAVAVGTWVHWASDLTPLANITDNVASNNNFKLRSGFENETWKRVYGGFSNTENASSNEVTIDGTTLDLRYVYGGYYFGQNDGKATQNKVTVKNGSIYNMLIGGYAENGTADFNEVNISADKIRAVVYGGYVYNGKAEQNEVKISKGEFEYAVYGGYTEGGSAKGNTVEIDEAKVKDEIVGGYAQRSNAGAEIVADGNIVTIKKGSFAKVYGGRVDGGGTAQNNEVILDGGDTNNAVYGGFIKIAPYQNNQTTGNVSKNNKVTIKDSSVLTVYGGKFDSAVNGVEGSVEGNKVNISGASTISSSVYGGSFETQVSDPNGTVTVKGNEVNISGGTIEKSVYGGRTIKGTANDNKVTITGGTINGSGIYGGDGSYDGSTVEENIVNITGGTFTNLDKVYGGHGDIATGNEVHIKNATINSSISNLYGGWGDTRASDNILVIEDSSIDSNGAFVAGGESPNGEANNNKVTIAGENIVVGTVVGGRGGKIADSNKVFITGGTITNNVYGGDATGSAGSANDNIVNFGINEDGKAEGIANVTGTVYGGRATTSTGNTLNVYTVGNKVGGLEKFQNMNFYIPKEANNGDVLVASIAGVNLTDVAVKAGFSNETALTTGDKVKLIASNVKVEGMNTESREKVSAGDFVNVDLKIYQGNDTMNQVTSGTATTLVAEIVGEEASESSKSLVETIAVGTAIIAEGGDLLAGAGLANAEAALVNDAEQGAPAGSATLFGAINANKSKIKSGSHVDVKGMNLNLGLVKEIKNNAGKFIVGPVVEYGKGKYDSYLDNGYHGEGDSHFVGGGLVAKQNNNNGMYYEGSVRAGKLMSDYKSNGGNYDSDSTYLAAHLGLGKVVKLNEKNSLDYYGKYFYSHQGSDDTTLHSALDHALHFDGVDSHRTRLGGRLNHVVKENNEVYIGFAWQHEFSSTARATIDGLGTPAPSCKGDTGIMELGWKVSETNKYDVDLGATGSIGKKKGAGINLSFNYKF